MKATQSQSVLDARIKAAGQTLEQLVPRRGVETMLAFYADVRAEECDLENDGDMLLLQWGTYDWGSGLSFSFDITRQFMLIESGAHVLYQLGLVFYYAPEPELRALEAGNEWCPSPSELGDFRELIESSDSFGAVADIKPAKVELRFSQV